MHMPRAVFAVRREKLTMWVGQTNACPMLIFVNFCFDSLNVLQKRLQVGDTHIVGNYSLHFMLWAPNAFIAV